MPLNSENTAAFHRNMEAAVRTNAKQVEKATDNPGEERELSTARECSVSGPNRVRCRRALGHAGEHSYWVDWE